MNKTKYIFIYFLISVLTTLIFVVFYWAWWHYQQYQCRVLDLKAREMKEFRLKDKQWCKKFGVEITTPAVDKENKICF
jgi:hypothetical protein